MDHYKRLGIDRDADEQTIKVRYHVVEQDLVRSGRHASRHY